jgi:hypothetical protein
VPSAVMIDIDGAVFKETNDLSSYDIWCDAPESRIHMEGDIPDIQEEFKPLTDEADMTRD